MSSPSRFQVLVEDKEDKEEGDEPEGDMEDEVFDEESDSQREVLGKIQEEQNISVVALSLWNRLLLGETLH